jgi:hypothetical protein
MMKPRYAFVGALLCFAPLTLQSCSGDSTPFTPVGDAGEGGASAGSAGSSANAGKGGGKGGSAGNAGKGGSSGSAAGSGQAGAVSAGEAGAVQAGGTGGEGGEGGASASSGAGATGDAGVGGAPTAVGGESGGPSGSGGDSGGADSGGADSGGAGGEPVAGAGGDAGSGGRGELDEGRACRYECNVDDDCESPGIIEYVCDETTKRCGAPDLSCARHGDCVAFASSWNFACKQDDDCLFATEACVDAGGYGRCAEMYVDGVGCGFPGQVSITRPKFGAVEELVEVCGNDNGRCGDGACFFGCTGASDCGEGSGDSCDTESGRCTCVADNECSSGRCNQRTQRCDECVSDFHCFRDPTRDRCVAGRCGCSSAEVCSDELFPAATPVCE